MSKEAQLEKQLELAKKQNIRLKAKLGMKELEIEEAEADLVKTYEGVRGALLFLGLDITNKNSVENFNLVSQIPKIMEMVTLGQDKVLSHFQGLIDLEPMIEKRAELFGLKVD